jgi:hypothetical protein
MHTIKTILSVIFFLVVFPFVFVIRELFSLHLLEKIKPVALGVSYEKAVELWGDPDEEEECDEYENTIVYTFSPSWFHEANVFVKNDVIQSVAYFSDKPDPNRDLQFVMKEYSDGKEWNTLTEGYLYQRDDRARRLWCSAMPAIGVGISEFLDGKKRDDLEDKKMA